MLNDAILADYASGALPSGMSLLVAAHLTFSPEGRARVAGFEAIGGALLEDADQNGPDVAPPEPGGRARAARCAGTHARA
jgi:anti-sigma factor ChrR (cupin superfamily)